MAHPHPTPDVPGSWPRLFEEVTRCAIADDVSAQLLAGLDPGSPVEVTRGHVCATTWVFAPTGTHVLLVRHRVFDWSPPGGHIEPHETTLDGGVRELEEETGLTRFDVHRVLDRPALVHVSDLPGDRPHRHWNVAWLYTAAMDSPLSPVEGARWWSVLSVPSGPPDLARTMNRLLDLLVRVDHGSIH